ncbi:MAG: hypothetical protein ACRD2I_22760, partial [Vicinamibacterales bacterium]
MTRSIGLTGIVTIAAALLLPSGTQAQNGSPLAGVWTLNRSLSEFRSDIGFNADWMRAAGTDSPQAGSSSGGRGRRGSGGGGSRGPAAPFSGRRESSEGARRVQLLTGEVRNPPARLMVIDTPAEFTLTNELGQSRTLHPDGREETIDVQGVPLDVTTQRVGDRVVVVYHVEPDRELRYTFSHAADPLQLIVDVQFLEHGTGDKARRIYEPGVAAPAPRQTTPDAAAAGSASRPAPDAFDQRPNAELIGLKNMGIVVEDLSAQAIACGLNHDAIEGALSKRLSDGGFVVRRNSDEDTYVYVNVMSSSAGNGMCVSRYDAFLYTQATAKLSYGDHPALVQVSLMHRGGIGTSAPSVHGAAVLR